ncbi:MAG: ribosome recycling factor [Candidatus Vogelbacteria bacterium]|nr:ribosome recycling factor [Candidatus Vogelbacteria bacterium]
MAYNFSPFKTQIEEIKTWLLGEFAMLRTGRATPTLLDSVMIDSYGSKMPIKHVANISSEDPKTLRITPWDASQIKAIETGIAASNIGVSTSPDSTSIRVIFPDLTEERRKMLVKLVGEKLEDARVSLRKEREKVTNDLNNQKKEGEISEDDLHRSKEELQKLVDEANRGLEGLADKKEVEIMEI